MYRFVKAREGYNKVHEYYFRERQMITARPDGLRFMTRKTVAIFLNSDQNAVTELGFPATY